MKAAQPSISELHRRSATEPQPKRSAAVPGRSSAYWRTLGSTSGAVRLAVRTLLRSRTTAPRKSSWPATIWTHLQFIFLAVISLVAFSLSFPLQTRGDPAAELHVPDGFQV